MIKYIKSFFVQPEDCSHSDWVNLQIFTALLFMQLLNAYTALQLDGSNKMSLPILGVAIIVCGYFALRQLNSTDVFTLLCIYIFFVLNFVIDPSLTLYFTDSRMLAVYMLYVPAGVCIVRKIKDWNFFFKVCRPYCIIALLISIDAVLTVDTVIYTNYEFFSYMAYSYMVLPFVLCSYVVARREKSLIWLGVFIMLFVAILSYGARNAVLMTPLFVCAYEIFTGSLVKRFVMVVVLIVVGVAFFLFIDKIMYSLSLIPIFENSRLITRFLAKTVTSGGERDLLFNEGMRQLMHMELEVPGLFGDRKVINGVYPHNIILETMLQFGWILGIVFNICVFGLVFYSIFLSRYKVMGIYLFFALLGKLFVSDSYVWSINFWMWLFGVISICSSGRSGKLEWRRRRRKLPDAEKPPLLTTSKRGPQVRT